MSGFYSTVESVLSFFDFFFSLEEQATLSFKIMSNWHLTEIL